MAKGPKFEFKLEKGGLDAGVPKKLRDYSPAGMKPTDKNQTPPTTSNPTRSRYQQSGGS